MPAGTGGHGRLRAAHADREQVIDLLKAAFVQGRLAKDEFEARVGQALASRTYADLAAITADLPAGLTGTAPPRKPVRAKARPPVNPDLKAVVPVITGMTVLTAGLWAAVLGARLSNDGAVDLLLLTVTFAYFGILILAGAVMRESRHQKRSGGQLPRRPAQRGQALDGEQDGGIGNDLIRCQARSDSRARRLLGHSVTQRIWRSVPTRRARRSPFNRMRRYSRTARPVALAAVYLLTMSGPDHPASDIRDCSSASG